MAALAAATRPDLHVQARTGPPAPGGARCAPVVHAGPVLRLHAHDARALAWARHPVLCMRGWLSGVAATPRCRACHPSRRLGGALRMVRPAAGGPRAGQRRGEPGVRGRAADQRVPQPDQRGAARRGPRRRRRPVGARQCALRQRVWHARCGGRPRRAGCACTLTPAFSDPGRTLYATGHLLVEALDLAVYTA